MLAMAAEAQASSSRQVHPGLDRRAMLCQVVAAIVSKMGKFEGAATVWHMPPAERTAFMNRVRGKAVLGTMIAMRAPSCGASVCPGLAVLNGTVHCRAVDTLPGCCGA